VAIGSALGGMARFALTLGLPPLVGASFPWATLLINILGSFVIGWFGTLSAPGGRYAGFYDTRAFVMVGVCGGFTTFSSFSLQTFELLQRGETLRASGYIIGSVLLCLLGVWLGIVLARG
jgi:CrcB protein